MNCTFPIPQAQNQFCQMFITMFVFKCLTFKPSSVRNLSPFLLSVFLCVLTVTVQGQLAEITGGCIGAIPPTPFVGTGCGIPPYVDPIEFGDNAYSRGTLKVKQNGGKMRFSISLRNLSRTDLVMTAWILWTVPSPSNPPIYNVAQIASPLASSDASFSTGRGRDPNQLTNNGKAATLKAILDFNPTYPDEGPLTSNRFSFQADNPSVAGTEFVQYPIAADGRFSPTTSFYLRRYDSTTGFVKLDADGKQELVRSPNRALGISIAAHLDKTTHGVSQGFFGFDHFEVLTFMFSGPLGNPIFS